jgi:2-polyprenyl-3-methyl-5-hydroxy-6-metoxy-1,4-benzoquinol methylase
LDLGCGESGNFIELAKKGFDVSLVDISESVIRGIRKKAEEEGIKVRVFAVDVRNFKFREKYDVILCLGLLHFLTREEGYGLLNKMKKHTKRNGLNIVIAFRKGDKSQTKEDSFYVRKGELKRIYRDWKILDYEEYREGKNLFCYLVARY